MPIRTWEIMEEIHIKCDSPGELQQIVAHLTGREPARLEGSAARELERLLLSSPQVEFDAEGGCRVGQ